MVPVPKSLVFEWDTANIAHIAQHNITPEEAEQVIRGGSLPVSSEEREGEERHAELGETAAGRLLIVVWTLRGQRVRVVTAFPASRKWNAFWRRIREGGSSAQEKTGTNPHGSGRSTLV